MRHVGSNAGIGFELVKILASKPEVEKVYLTARSVDKGVAAQKALHDQGLKKVAFVQLDVTDPASVAAVKKTVEETDGRLDVLVNNAGECITSLEL